jgi:nucleoside phosphorylase
MPRLPRPSYDEEPLIPPHRAVEELARRRGLRLEELRTPEWMLLSLSVGATEPLVKETRARERPWIYRARPLYIGELWGEAIGVIWAAPGAPLAAMVLEDLIACGAKLFIGLGLLGAIQPEIEVGDIVIPTLALRLEGTSHHYLPPDVEEV